MIKLVKSETRSMTKTFTFHNYTVDDLLTLKEALRTSALVKYSIIGEEITPTSGN